jgi:hypothetical protein
MEIYIAAFRRSSGARPETGHQPFGLAMQGFMRRFLAVR